MPDRKNKPGWLPASWPAPANVRAGTTTRNGGVSPAPFTSFNLADHVGDDPGHVAQNRMLLCRELGLRSSPVWLQQRHGNRVIEINRTHMNRDGDGAYTRQHQMVCAVLTADCLPLLLCNRQGTQIAAIHVGWRGFSNNIIANSLSAFSSSAADLLAWIGPCISAQHYEVGREVYRACAQVTGAPSTGFTQTCKNHWLADLASLVKNQLQSSGVINIFGGDHCTYVETDLFYSYRRDGKTGRTASLIWME
jgi:YfiH family protein